MNIPIVYYPDKLASMNRKKQILNANILTPSEEEFSIDNIDELLDDTNLQENSNLV